jgi:hypothetical protein
MFKISRAVVPLRLSRITGCFLLLQSSSLVRLLSPGILCRLGWLISTNASEKSSAQKMKRVYVSETWYPSTKRPGRTFKENSIAILPTLRISCFEQHCFFISLLNVTHCLFHDSALMRLTDKSSSKISVAVSYIVGYYSVFLY